MFIHVWEINIDAQKVIVRNMGMRKETNMGYKITENNDGKCFENVDGIFSENTTFLNASAM